MSDDLVKHLRNSKGWPTLGNAAADRIEELEAKLAKAVEALERADRAIMDTTNDLDLIRVASVFDHMLTIRTTLAELKGEM